MLGYQDGKFTGSAIKVGLAQGDALEVSDVEELLRGQCGVKLSGSTNMNAKEQAALNRMRELGIDEEEDEED